MTIRMEIEYASNRLFIIEPREDDPGLAKKVTCKLCGELLFDCDRDRSEKLELFFHGLKAHFQIQHQITMAAMPCTDPGCVGGH